MKTLSLKARLAAWRATLESRRRDEERRAKQQKHALARWEKTKAPADHKKLVDANHRLKATRDSIEEAKRAVAKLRDAVAHQQKPLRVRALEVAESLVGVMEQGGNNVGPTVTKIIRENGGGGPEPWCGDFVAYCYRHAGSKMVTRSWAAVSYLGWLTGMKVVSSPQPGAIVIYTFSHTGLFKSRVAPGTIDTVEGNTGASGAVSDSRTGGDGVYEKHRSTGLVRRYVIPTR
jgi:hypothetical protein